MNAAFPGLDLLFLEAGGDNLAASFSPELVDVVIYVIDVAGGDKIPRKGGPGIIRSNLLVINKTDLAPYVGADLGVMERDAKKQRGARPFIFSNLKNGDGVDRIVSWLEHDVLSGDHPLDTAWDEPHSHEHPHEHPHSHPADHSHPHA